MSAQMSFAEFSDSMRKESAPPSGLSGPLQALWLDAKGDWDGAHAQAQAVEGTAEERAGYWVHAYLHRKEGDAGKNMYVLIKGKVSVSIQGHEVERIGPGGVFGEMALVDQGTRAATATATTDCQLLTITRPDFLALVKSKPGFAVSLLRAIAERLRNMTLQKK